ncbi:hypothetical protein [Plantactinospora sp. CA-290183]|uniref:hypothetical protein n=1 Tax=Plantactinospora sp. CA-290183 TaxID=3240006 RepID=UPI003D8E2B45
MIETHLVLKYCGERINAQALTDAVRADTSQPTVASELRDALTALSSTEIQLAELVSKIDGSLREVGQVLAAGADDLIPPIETTGVLQARGPRFDTLLARRAAQIEHLRAITRLWMAQRPEPATSIPQ